MDDLINRRAAIDAVHENYDKILDFKSDGKTIASSVEDIICDLPSARKKGKWIKYKDRACWYCSECKEDNYYAYSWDSDTGENKFQDHYCPNCGAEMEMKDEEL